MPTYTKLGSGSWRVQVRRKRQYIANTFIRRRDAEEWAIEAERSIDRGTAVRRSKFGEQPRIFSDLIALHLDDLAQVGKPVRRSKSMVLKALKTSLGRVNLRDLSRERLIEFGRKRASQGAGPATLAIDFSFIRAILLHAAAVHGIDVSVENVQLAKAALKHLNLVGKSNERDRRPTQDELDRLIGYAESNPQQFLPLGRIIRFAIATAMRQAEISRIEWSDVDLTKRTVTIRDRKDPRRKDGNHQKVPLLNSTGYDAWQLVLEQRIVTRGVGRVFPHHSKSVGAAFHRSCKAIDIDDLCFHDLRHEGTSRLFEAGFSIQQVAMVTGHKDWRMLRRYTNLKPEDLHKMQKAAQPSIDQFMATLVAS
ncbi:MULTISPECIES: integrase [Bradyrhizobium]|jgi:integrase|uniref:integrase n=1 Tax=Bradyrhizobium TaxID=374 RepID=UPI0004816ABB|nr:MULTISPECIES: site-specific integrase [Bradyrhizobium]MCS3448642.1 integrase [Bradyrhizobium elkanii]MCS3560214.1 integrase [Bradyrhizobium elkanii]MCW2149939.1 integrase [Bradyrhizobium elkanii]MCW2360089.1 integrase [Bradyrhizobium elkanii]MCW2373671.1 integrase [Bradyrhizobium elkanii]